MRKFSASVWLEGDLYVAECLDIDIASQGETESEALNGLNVAIRLHFMPPVATEVPKVSTIEVEIGAS